MGKVNFFTEDIDDFQLKNKKQLSQWIEKIISLEKKKLEELNYIFCNDDYLHQINLEYLQHDTFTDIITFDNSESPDTIEGDIFISIERVKENAVNFNAVFLTELKRVMIHGVLHLIGYPDKTEAEAQKMRLKEEEALNLFITS